MTNRTSEYNFPTQLLKTLRFARQVAVLTGAGISAESGLATFRDPMTGLWAKFRPEELATPEAFQRNPKLVWEWYQWRREQVEKAAPNPGHFALAQIESKVPKFSLITQNVDSLHQQTGSKNVVELHGNIRRTKCFEENIVVESWPETEDVPPHCPRCGGLLRPDVVWFGENLPLEALYAAANASKNADLFFSIGTSGQVEPAASLPRLAQQNGATVVTINLEVTTTAFHKVYNFNGRAGEILPALVQKAWAG